MQQNKPSHDIPKSNTLKPFPAVSNAFKKKMHCCYDFLHKYIKVCHYHSEYKKKVFLNNISLK